MTSLEAEVTLLTRIYIRKGGKANRRQQQRRMLAFAKHAAQLGARCMAQVGRGQVIEYWKKNEHLADATLYAQFLAVRELFCLAGKAAEPPAPRMKAVRAARAELPRFPGRQDVG